MNILYNIAMGIVAGILGFLFTLAAKKDAKSSMRELEKSREKRHSSTTDSKAA